MTIRIIRFVLATAVAVTLTGCVQRTVYRHPGMSSGGSSNTSTKQKASSSKIHWFWQKDFWTSE